MGNSTRSIMHQERRATADVRRSEFTMSLVDMINKNRAEFIHAVKAEYFRILSEYVAVKHIPDIERRVLEYIGRKGGE